MSASDLLPLSLLRSCSVTQVIWLAYCRREKMPPDQTGGEGMYECEESRRMRRSSTIRMAILSVAFAFGVTASEAVNTAVANKLAHLFQHLLAGFGA